VTSRLSEPRLKEPRLKEPRLKELSAQVRELEERVRAGGGAERVAKQHKQGKLTARERVARLCDEEAASRDRPPRRL
jgi:acetyl-CoA carboxylase carboxyltransferase component